MATRMLVLFWGMLLVCCCRQSVTAGVPTPTTWPVRFHALLVRSFAGNLGVMDLWYDWGKGGNLLIIQDQLEKARYDMEWTNGTSFYYDTYAKTCKTVEIGFGILRPDWLKDADFVGVKEMAGFTCNVFNKLDFITYYEEVETGKPVYWKFYTGREVYVITFEPGVALSEEIWQAPEYCFSDGQIAVSEKESVIHEGRSESPFMPEYREWLSSRATSA